MAKDKTGDIYSKTHQEWKTGFVEDQREFFDSLITQDWDTYFLPQWDVTRQIEVKQILSLIPDPKSVLDIGCGCGYHDVLFAQSLKDTKVVGIDNSSKSIEQANLHYPHPGVERFTIDILNSDDIVKRISSTFDLVTSFQVIEHLSRPQEFLNSCTKLCSQNGYIAIVTPNQARLYNRLLALVGLKPEMIDPLHFREYTLNELRFMGKKSGLKTVGSFGHTFDLSFKGLRIINANTGFGMNLGIRFPSLATVIGVVFQKK